MAVRLLRNIFYILRPLCVKVFWTGRFPFVACSSLHGFAISKEYGNALHLLC